MLTRRDVLSTGTLAAGALALPLDGEAHRGAAPPATLPDAIAALAPMKSPAGPITADERRARVEKAVAPSRASSRTSAAPSCSARPATR